MVGSHCDLLHPKWRCKPTSSFVPNFVFHVGCGSLLSWGPLALFCLAIKRSLSTLMDTISTMHEMIASSAEEAKTMAQTCQCHHAWGRTVSMFVASKSFCWTRYLFAIKQHDIAAKCKMPKTLHQKMCSTAKIVSSLPILQLFFLVQPNRYFFFSRS